METNLEFIGILLYVFIFAFGLVIGSFLNVCIYRIPKKESIVVVPSHCMSCGYHLKWYDLIPLFSWLFLKGRCRKCGEKISPQYPMIEAINGIAYVGIFAMSNWDFGRAICLCLLFSALLVLSVIDWRTYEIPLGINIFILVIAIAYTVIDKELWLTHVIGFFAVSVPLYLLLVLSKGRAIGGGDVKLMAVAGLLLGWQNILLAFALGCIIGSVLHILRMKFAGADRVLAMGPYLSIGIMIAALWGQSMIQWYVSLLMI